MPDMVFTQTADELWEEYLSQLWKNFFLQSGVNLKTGVIVEIGPGRRYKIGNALAKLGFTGTLYIVEPDNVAVKEVVHKCRELMPNATIVPVAKTLQECSTYIELEVDAIVANHLLDDILMNEYINAAHLNEVFNRGEPTYNLLKEAWPKLLSDKAKLVKLMAKLKQDLNNLLKYLNPKIVIFSQYKSYYFTKMFEGKEVTPDTVAIEFLSVIRNEFGKPTGTVKTALAMPADIPPNLDKVAVIQNTQLADFWMINQLQ